MENTVQYKRVNPVKKMNQSDINRRDKSIDALLRKIYKINTTYGYNIKVKNLDEIYVREAGDKLKQYIETT